MKKKNREKPDLDVLEYAKEQVKGSKYAPNITWTFENGKWILKDCKTKQ